MLTINKTYSINRGRVHSSIYNGIDAPVRFGGFLLPDFFGGAENTTGFCRIISRDYRHAVSPRSLAGLGNFSQKVYIMQNQLVFKGKALTPIILNNQPYLGVSQIGLALGYGQRGCQNDTPLRKLYERHADEFTPDMSFLTTIDTPGGKQQVRVFSLRGCHLLAMFSKTPVAKEFRKWVLDLIEQHTTPAPVDAQAADALVASIIRNVANNFEFSVWKDIIAASLAARCENMIRLKEKELRKKIATEILETK